MYREGISRSGLCWLRCIYLRTPCEESQRRRRSAKNAAMDKVEPEKHPLDLSIVRSLNLNQNGFEACALSEALATGYRNAAHAMLWAPADMLVMQRYQQKAIVLVSVVLSCFGFCANAPRLNSVKTICHECLPAALGRLTVFEHPQHMSLAYMVVSECTPERLEQ